MSWLDRYPAERLADPDDGWEGRYGELAAHLTTSLGPAWIVEHVGSTSVPGLLAKPVIDIAMRLPEDLHVHDASKALKDVGWTQLEVIGDHWATFLLTHGVRTAIGHVFRPSQWRCAHVRLFADWLRKHPEDAREYADLKSGLVAEGVWGSDYTDGKGYFVLRTVNRAREAKGLPAIDGPL